jgi:telomerase Cajal body protein 1
MWTLGRPGRDHDTISLKSDASGLKGIASSLAVAPLGDFLAVGSFSRGIGICDLRTHDLQCSFAGHSGGITHLMFSRYVLQHT